MDIPDTEAAGRSRRRRIRRLLFLVVPVLALVAGVYLFLFGGRYVTTENAYIKASIVNVGSEVNGKVAEVAVSENQPVRAGQLLLRIDSRPYDVALRDAEARLQQARLQIGSMKATFAQNQSALAAARDDLVYARKQYLRIRNLREREAVSQSTLDQVQHDLDVSESTVRQLDSELAETRAQLGGDPRIAPELHPYVMAAQAALEKAKLDVERCELRAPIDGIASQVPQRGQYASPGLPLLSVVANRSTWIEANFKEDQLARIRAGAPVEVEVDAYPGRRWQARVDSIGQATGAEFAMLPPQNASGNWVKIVQRIPVRLSLQHRDDDPELRAGMSAYVKVDAGLPARMQPLHGLLAAIGLPRAPAPETLALNLAQP